LYYFNTFDGQGEINVDKMTADIKLEDQAAQDQADCDSCVI
jgi:hypothetical protein